MATRTTGFKALNHGFRFRNRFQFSFDLDFPLLGSVDLGRFTYGLCGGMCFSALDFFHARMAIPPQPEVPPVGSPLYLRLVDRQVDSLSLPRGVFRVLEWMLLDDREVVRRTASEEFPRLRRAIDRRRPVVLCLIRQRGFTDPGLNHQVVARQYSYDSRARTAEIVLYDPNHPGQEPLLSADFSGSGNGPALQQSTGEALRGFFLMEYRYEAPRPA